MVIPTATTLQLLVNKLKYGGNISCSSRNHTFPDPEQFWHLSVFGSDKGWSSPFKVDTGSISTRAPVFEHRAQAKYPGPIINVHPEDWDGTSIQTIINIVQNSNSNTKTSAKTVPVPRQYLHLLCSCCFTLFTSTTISAEITPTAPPEKDATIGSTWLHSHRKNKKHINLTSMKSARVLMPLILISKLKNFCNLNIQILKNAPRSSLVYNHQTLD